MNAVIPYTPDIAAMLILMAVLLFLRRLGERRDVTLWLAGLSFILIEAIAAALYHIPLPERTRALAHSVALAAYVVAALAFVWNVRAPNISRRDALLFALVRMFPLVVLCFFYGEHVTSVRAWQSVIWTAVGGIAIMLFLLRRRLSSLLYSTLVELVAWGPVPWFTAHGRFREVVYWGLAWLYFGCGLLMVRLLRRSRPGGIIVVLSFQVWAICMLTHPYLGASSALVTFFNQTWTMQKFFVTIGLLLVLLDESRRENLQLALYDALTNLPNRRLLNDRLEQAVQLAARNRTAFAVFLIDLNEFKKVNDTQGHAEGDLLLRAAADRLRGVVRSSDTLARWGGDEFAVVANGTRDRDGCEALCKHLVRALRMEYPIIDASVGYALYPEDGEDLPRLLERADFRMYEAKPARGVKAPA